MPRVIAALAGLLLSSCANVNAPSGYDVVIRNGTIVDGSGGAPYVGDVAIRGDRIVALAPRIKDGSPTTIDATGLTVTPGFINMLSWANETLIEDGAGESDIRQGVTLEVFGEGTSMGPYNQAMVATALKLQDDIKYPIAWRTLGGYLDWLTRRGVAPNVASFVGATTVRIHVLGEDDVDPTPAQLDQMRELVRQAMDEGALGVGSSLIYVPATFAETDELVALASVSARCGGLYISHMRDEGDKLIESIDELVTIARRSGGPAEIYHLKQSGRANWGKLGAAVARVEAARAEGLRITADMYNYPASSTGLNSNFPDWVKEGGHDAFIARLKEPASRARLVAELRKTDWLRSVGDARGVLLVGFRNDRLKPLAGTTLADVARQRGTSPEDTAIDLIVEDDSRVQVVYFAMNESNVARQLTLPWMAFGSDAGAQAPRGAFLKSSTHPRAYGNFARLLGKYVRDEKRVTLPEAVRRLTSFPASNLGIRDRGRLAAGMKADLAIFDAATIADKATFDKPQQFAVGMRHVLVNGQLVLRDGEMTSARPGQAVRGQGWQRCPPRP
ncbi:MAG: D-aminoacylase [Pseudomonadota bacterium]|nr:D-aminoacylase [Pseudomonadota bacterium]